MARKKQPVETGFVLFDVMYEDGTRSSNRKVAKSDLAEAEMMGQDPTDTARAMIEAQDRKIAEMSGNPRGRIKTISRAKA